MFIRDGSHQFFLSLWKAVGERLYSRLVIKTLPGGVIGNTAEFGSAFPGSSPGWAAMRQMNV